MRLVLFPSSIDAPNGLRTCVRLIRSGAVGTFASIRESTAKGVEQAAALDQQGRVCRQTGAEDGYAKVNSRP